MICLVWWKLSIFSAYPSQILFMKRLAFFVLCPFIAGCMHSTDAADAGAKLRQAVELGHSNYYIRLPEDIEMAEAKGLSGQPGYSFHPKQSDFSSLGFISVDSGGLSGVRDASACPVRKTDVVYARLLDDQVRWVIEDRGRFLDATTSLGKVSANIYTKDRKYIDRMIDVFSTLQKGH